MSGEDFLSRWSRRKLASKAPPAPAAAPPAAGGVPAQAETESASAAAEPQPPAPLPPVESLTPDSDFTGFMRPEVDPALRRQALRTLFRDPRFNVMDGLDVYIDDYSKPDPIPPEWLDQLNQVARLGDYRPPEPTREPLPTPEDAPELARNCPSEQALASDDRPGPSDTPAAGSPPPELKES